MKTRIYLGAIFIASFTIPSGKVLSQNQSTQIGGSMHLPPSPTPASIVNQIDQNIQYYTGALNVSIPLYTLRSRSLELPIGLSYNGSGIKVNDIASWAGLGWSLNAGGVISRVMRGLPDEFTGQIWVGQRFVPSKGWLDPAVRGNSGLEIIDYFTSTTGNNRVNVIEFSNKTGTNVYGGADPQTWDTEPDEFYFHFGKYSGKFIFDKNGLVQMIPAQNLKITNIQITPQSTLGSGTNSREITSFQVIDEAGVVYTFGNTNVTSIASLTAVERTYHHYFSQNILCGRLRLPSDPNDNFFNPEIFGSPESFRIYKWAIMPILQIGQIGSTKIEAVNFSFTKNYLPFTSTWHLTKIESPNGDDFINFSYLNEDIKYMTSHTVDVQQDNLDIYRDYFPYQKSEHVWKKLYYGSFRKLTTPTHLEDEKGLTSFMVGNDVINVVTPFYPQSTTVSTAYNTVSSKRLNQITDAVGNKITFLATDLRLDLSGSRLLNQINIHNIDNQLVKSFRFDHGYTAAAPVNEQNQIDITFDRFIYWFPAPGTSGVVWWPITEYGLDANGPHSPEAEAVYNSEWANNWTEMVMFDYFRLYLLGISESSDNWGSKKQLFTFNYDTTEVLPRRLSPRQDHWGYFNQNTTGHTIPIYNYSTTWPSAQWVPFSNQTLWAYEGVNVALPFRQTNIWDSNKNEPLNVDPEFKANRDANFARTQCGILKEVHFPTGSKRVFTYELNTQGTTSKGGLRVSKVDDYPDKNSSYFERREIKYFNGVPSSDSYIYGESWDQDPLNIESIRNSITVSSAPLNFTPTTKGGSVGYARVEEFMSGLGKTTYYFKNPASDPDVASPVLDIYANTCLTCPNYAPKTDNDHLRGLLFKTEITDNSNKLLKRNTTTYSVNPAGFNPKVTYGLKAGVRFQFNSGNPIDDRKQFAGFYSYKHDFVSIQSQTEELYDQSDPGNEGKKIITTTHYTYTRPDQSTVVSDLMPRKVTTVLANGDNLVSESKYPSDYTTTSEPTDVTAKGIHLLKSKKIESVPIETISYLERTDGGLTSKYLLGASLTKFKEFQTGKVYPWEAYKLKAGIGNTFTMYTWSTIDINNNFSWTNSINFKRSGSIDSYDAFGNPLTETGEDGIQKTFTWGYNSSLLTSLLYNAGTYQHQTSYIYKPLVGITQVTDPNSRNSKYTYDNFNRLKLARDHDDNILNRYRYNYKGAADNTASFNHTINTNNSVTFNATGYASGSQLTWNFGNGTIKENGTANETATYPTPGQYTVTLTVAHAEYAPTTTTKVITILPAFSIAITAPTPTNGSNRTVSCGNSPTTTCVATATGGPYTYKWEYNYSASGSSTWYSTGSNSSILSFSLVGANASSNQIRCKITDGNGNIRYSSNTLTIFYTCGTQPGPSDCLPGWVWNAQLGRCDPPQGYCGEGCFWSGIECVCQ